MKKVNWFYVITIICIVLFTFLYVNAEDNISKWIFSLTSSWGFFTILFKYFWDERKQINEHYLNSNITYHAYIKLSEFWEEYTKELYDTLDFLWKKWWNEEILDYAKKLYLIRRKYSLYLSNTINIKLKEFESELRYIWAQTELLKHIPVGEERSDIVKKISKKFLIIINQEWENEEKIASIDKIVDEIKDIIWATKIIDKRNQLV